MTTTLFTNARLIDPEAGTDSPGWLMVRDGQFAGRGDGADTPQADQTIDCNGKCLKGLSL